MGKNPDELICPKGEGGKHEYYFDGPDGDSLYSAGCLVCGHWLAYDWKAWWVLKQIEDYKKEAGDISNAEDSS
jgi:hypothetical protein